MDILLYNQLYRLSHYTLNLAQTCNMYKVLNNLVWARWVRCYSTEIRVCRRSNRTIRLCILCVHVVGFFLFLFLRRHNSPVWTFASLVDFSQSAFRFFPSFLFVTLRICLYTIPPSVFVCPVSRLRCGLLLNIWLTVLLLFILFIQCRSPYNVVIFLKINKQIKYICIFLNIFDVITSFSAAHLQLDYCALWPAQALLADRNALQFFSIFKLTDSSINWLQLRCCYKTLLYQLIAVTLLL